MHWVSTPRYQLQQSLNVLNLTRAHGCLLLQPKFVGSSHDTYIYFNCYSDFCAYEYYMQHSKGEGFCSLFNFYVYFWNFN